jgi:hypothetical protein
MPLLASVAYCTAPASIASRANSNARSAVEASIEVVNRSQRMSPTRSFEPSDRRIDARHFPGSRSKASIWKHFLSFDRSLGPARV